MNIVYKNKRELVKGIIFPEDVVLDVGFWGQGVTVDDENWPHKLLKNRAKDVYGIDLDFDTTRFDKSKYFKMSAEKFILPVKFDVIFASDLIEHLSNPGLFLGSCAQHLKSGGKLILTTPNCFNLFNMAEKITKYEPTVNSDHTCYFNFKTIEQLFEKNGWIIDARGYVFSLDINYKESLKKKFLNILYYLVSLVTPKFLETIVIVAKRNNG